MELDRLERERMDEDWGLAEGVTRGVTPGATQAEAEDAGFSAAILVGVWGKLTRRHLQPKKPWRSARPGSKISWLLLASSCKI
jgi:hypothetical protein